ncbi:heavy metal-associated isoprenylated plant protein 3-like [Prunus yedoensis var. nudiflora]|uniref:Heavy metal-associated isoprenylated plant protein 3-like n=1 Tax=Prunus yedoensis var. nudiflora TaxID=2094558 RepID=A0A314XQE0_PRUYE|nr:heavy metal-associated isoprenylated plant protein 3-like [Prunus yedoensis var. nudiflora]
MGEDKKEEKKEGKDGKKAEEKKEEKKEEEPPEILLKVDMHCEACARKVARALKGFEGVEDVTTDSKASKVVVKGKAADPIKVCERLQKKSGKKVELISPLPKPPRRRKKNQLKKLTRKRKKRRDQTYAAKLRVLTIHSPSTIRQAAPPAVVTVVLTVRMHCEACAQLLQKRIRKIKGVESVATDVANDQVVVKGVVDPAKLAEEVYKKTRKQVSIVKEEEKKEEEKKEEEKKEGEKKEGEEDKGSEDNKVDIKRTEYWPTKFYSDYSYPSPQIFSDENPNACSVM